LRVFTPEHPYSRARRSNAARHFALAIDDASLSSSLDGIELVAIARTGEREA